MGGPRDDDRRLSSFSSANNLLPVAKCVRAVVQLDQIVSGQDVPHLVGRRSGLQHCHAPARTHTSSDGLLVEVTILC